MIEKIFLPFKGFFIISVNFLNIIPIVLFVHELILFSSAAHPIFYKKLSYRELDKYTFIGIRS